MATTGAMIPTKDSGKTSIDLDGIVRLWLIRFSAIYDRQVNSALPNLWCESLCDLSIESVEVALRKIESTFIPTSACPYPTPGHVRKLIEISSQLRTEQEADQAWQSAMHACEQQYHPDIGWRGPKLTERVARAIASAGGVHYVTQCSCDELVWAKKRFVESYLRAEKL